MGAFMKRNYILFILALCAGNMLVAMESPKAMASITLAHDNSTTNEPLLFSNHCTSDQVMYALREPDWKLQLHDIENLSNPVSGKVFSKALSSLRNVAEDNKNAPEIAGRARDAARFIIVNCDKFYTDTIETNPNFINNYDESANVAFVARAIPLEYWQDQNRFTPEARSKLFKLLNSDACKQFTIGNLMGSDAGALSMIRSFSIYKPGQANEAVKDYPEAKGRLINLRNHPSKYIKKPITAESALLIAQPIPTIIKELSAKSIKAGNAEYVPTKGFADYVHNILIQESTRPGVYYLAQTKQQNSRWIKPAVITALFGGAAALGWYTYPQWKSYVQPFNPLPSLRSYATQTMAGMSQRFGFGSIQ